MINFSFETQTKDEPSKGIVRMSYKILSWKRFRTMDKDQQQKLLKAIDQFQKMLTETKKQIREWKVD